MNRDESAGRADGTISVTILAATLTIGGAEQLLLELLRGIDRQRFAIRLCFLDQPGLLGEEILDLGFPCTSGISRGRFDLLTIKRLCRIFAVQKPDILLLINHRNCLFYGIPAARISSIPYVINWQNETCKPYSLHRLTMACRRLLHRAVDTVVAAAQGHREYIASVEGVPQHKIVVIYNGVDPGKFCSDFTPAQAKGRLGIAPDSPVAGIVAALRPDKAHEVFFEGAARVLKSLPSAQFLVVGDGPQRDFIERYAAELGIRNAVHFLGFRRDMGDVLRAMDVFCLSSRPHQETLSVAALEAMAAGLPVVATRVGFMHEIVLDGQTGYLVPVDDPHVLADSMVEVLCNAELRFSMGQKGRALVDRAFTLLHMVASFEELFIQAANRGGPGRL